MSNNERAMLNHIKLIIKKNLETRWEEIAIAKQEWNSGQRLLWKSQVKNIERQLYKIERELFGHSISELTFYIPKKLNSLKS